MTWGELSPELYSNLYHICAVVDDLDRARREIGDQLGISEWTPQVATPARAYRRANGEVVTTSVKAIFSLSGPPHFELIESHDEPHTLWLRAGGARLDHIGVHAADAGAESERLVQSGLTFEAEFLDLPADGGQPVSRQVYYLRDPLGIRIEVVDVSRRPYLRSWLETGVHAAPAD